MNKQTQNTIKEISIYVDGMKRVAGYPEIDHIKVDTGVEVYKLELPYMLAGELVNIKAEFEAFIPKGVQDFASSEEVQKKCEEYLDGLVHWVGINSKKEGLAWLDESSDLGKALEQYKTQKREEVQND